MDQPKTTSRTWSAMAWIAPVVSLALLSALMARELTYPRATDAEPYHAAVRAAASEVPFRYHGWVGTDVEPMEAAVRLLKPNHILNRRFVNEELNVSASILIVHCTDARDLAGHYAGNCYPAHGWEEADKQPWRQRVEGLDIDGVFYTYEMAGPGGTQRLWVANFMLLPDNQIVADMDTVYYVASDYLRRFYGAAQFQIVMDGRQAANPELRERVIEDMLHIAKPMLTAILSETNP